ncbi:hypothetical protein VV01_21540 [Luteipulveratus halotolerans]|uniref:Uncharacterized protein n=1 Tax=Luteipulveratus halotolerans TaxID=1631356 RepID=A0A0L6CED2_9MICO|nr:hypothetical protein VV01_21540 [Luteipulveratus halotolerans]
MTMSGEDVVPFPVYWDRQTWELSRSAYLADFDDLPSSPSSWVSWLQEALECHVRRSAQVRMTLEVAPPERRAKGSRQELERAGKPQEGFSKTHLLPRELIVDIERAISDDRREAGRMVSRSAFARESVVAAVEQTRARRGSRGLPPAPARLPNRPPRRPSDAGTAV